MRGIPEIAPASRLSRRHGYFSGRAYALGVILLSFYYQFVYIIIGVNGSLNLERHLHRDGWFSKPPLIAVFLESRQLSLNIYHNSVLLLATSLPIR